MLCCLYSICHGHAIILPSLIPGPDLNPSREKNDPTLASRLVFFPRHRRQRQSLTPLTSSRLCPYSICAVTLSPSSMPLTSDANSNGHQPPAKMSSSGNPPRRNGRNHGQDLNHVSVARALVRPWSSVRLTRSPHLQLLGFTLPPRSAPASTHLPRRSTKRTHYHGGFDRQRFVHQFRYVVKPDKGMPRLWTSLLSRARSQADRHVRDRAIDYTAHFADPDIHLDWSDILQVILPTSSSALSTVSTSGIDQAVDGESGRKGGAIPTCPICLSEPTAARMVSLV